MLRTLRLASKILESGFCRSLGRPCLPYRLEIVVTDACNLRCQMCSIWQRQRSPNPLPLLGPSQWARVFGELGGHLHLLGLTGGEPFLREDLPDIILAASQHCHNLELVSVNTNGYLPGQIEAALTRSLAGLPSSTRLYVTISLDGPQPVHDRIRGVADSFAMAEETFQRLTRLRRKHNNLVLNREITASRLNIEHLPSLIDRLDQQKQDYILTFAEECAYFNNQGRNVSLLKVPKERLEPFLCQVLERCPRGWSRDKLVKRLFLQLAPFYYANPERQVLPCYSSWSKVFVGPHGTVYPCFRYDTALGELTEQRYSLRSVLSNPQTKKIRDRIKQGHCPNCWTPSDGYFAIVQNLGLALGKAAWRGALRSPHKC